MSANSLLHEKAKKLFYLFGFNYKQFAKAADIPYATVHEFFNSDKNVTLSNFQKLVKPLGLDLEIILQERIDELLGLGRGRNQDNDDIALLINSLERIQRKTLLQTAIHLNRMGPGKDLAETIERIEKQL